MMNDGEETDNSGLIDITGGAEEPTPAEVEEVKAPAAAAPASDASSAADETAAAEQGAVSADSESTEEVPLTKKLVHAAEVAGMAALKVTNDVAVKVTEVSKHAYDKTEQAVRRMSKKEKVAESEATPGEAVAADGAEGEARAAEEAGSAEGEGEKVSLWNKVRRASGTAALKAAEAAQAAYKAAEPVGQKVADGAKSAYEKAKPVAESVATKTSEGASAAWQATKGGTMRAVDRVRSLSSAPSAHGSGHGAASDAATEGGSVTEMDTDIGEVTTSAEPEPVAESSDSKPESDEN